MRDFQCEIGVLFHEQNGEALFAVDFDDFLKDGFNEEGREAEELLEGYDGCGVGVLAAPLVNSS